MTDGDSGVAPQQQVVHGRSHDLATANHDGLLACDGYACKQAVGSGMKHCFLQTVIRQPDPTATCPFDELHAAVWGAGQEAVTQVSSSKLPGVDTRQPEKNAKTHRITLQFSVFMRNY